MKRIISLLLCLLMLFCLTAGALASSEPQAETDPAEITDAEPQTEESADEPAEEVPAAETDAEPAADAEEMPAAEEAPAEPNSLQALPVDGENSNVVDSGLCGDNLTWSLTEDGTLTVSGTGAMYDYYQNAPWESKAAEIRTLVIEDGVTSIGEWAFGSWEAAYSKLTSVTIPDSVTSIGWRAFYNIPGLTQITVGSGVTVIGEDAFWESPVTDVCIKDLAAWCKIDFESPLTFSYNTYSLYINGVRAEEITIPDSVTAISDYAFDSCASLIKVTVPDGVTSIGRSFNSCTNLTQITLPDSLREISPYAFFGCENLKAVTVPVNVTCIGEAAFGVCSSLTDLYIYNPDCDLDEHMCHVYSQGINPETGEIVSEGYELTSHPTIHGCTGSTAETFANENDLTFVPLDQAAPTATAAPTAAPTPTAAPDTPTGGSCGEDVTWTLQNGVLTISGTGAMDDNLCRVNDEGIHLITEAAWAWAADSITEVVIEDGVTSIGSCAFCGLTEVTQVSIGKDVTVIGDSAFNYCIKLPQVTIPDGVTYIGQMAFESCKALTQVTIPDSVTAIDWGAFESCSALKRTDIPGSVEELGTYAFSHCTALTEVNLAYGLTKIDTGAFYNCTALKQIIIPDSVTSIGEQAFNGCEALTQLTIGSGVTYIGTWAFGSCPGLTQVIIPAGVVSVGDQAFDGCTGLTDLYIYNAVCDMEYMCHQVQWAPGNDSPSGTLTTHPTIHGYADSTAQTFAEANGLTFVSLGTAPMPGGSCGNDLTWALSADGMLTVSGTGPMWDYSSIDSQFNSISILPWTGYMVTGVTMKDGITAICDNAFAGCTALTEIDIPDSVTEIGLSAFAGCTGLTEVSLSNSVTEIGYGVFTDCTALQNVDIPDSVTAISVSAFAVSGLTGISIPAAVESIDQSAFSDCTALTDLYIYNPDCVLNYICQTVQENGYWSVGDGWFAEWIEDEPTVTLTAHPTIHGYAGSTAQAYAEENGLTFAALSDTQPTPTPAPTTEPTDQPTPTAEPTAAPTGSPTAADTETKGDITGDGKTNIVDALNLFRAVNGQLETPAAEVADLNGDGKVNVVDALKLFRFVNGQIDTL